jgi:hypothetical protein
MSVVGPIRKSLPPLPTNRVAKANQISAQKTQWLAHWA